MRGLASTALAFLLAATAAGCTTPPPGPAEGEGRPPIAGGEPGAAPGDASAVAARRRPDRPTGREVMRALEVEDAVKDQMSLMDVSIQDGGGRQRTRKLVRLWKRGEDGSERILIKFLDPPDLRGLTLLTIDRGEEEERQWIYSPTLRKVKRVTATAKSEELAGSDFTLVDLRPEDYPAYDYKLVGVSAVDGGDCHVVEAVARSEDERRDTGYSKRLIWVRKEPTLAVRFEYYDLAGGLLKVQKRGDFGRVNGVWRPYKIAMENVRRGSRTEALVKYWRLNRGIEDALFRPSALEER